MFGLSELVQDFDHRSEFRVETITTTNVRFLHSCVAKGVSITYLGELHFSASHERGKFPPIFPRIQGGFPTTIAMQEELRKRARNDSFFPTSLSWCEISDEVCRKFGTKKDLDHSSLCFLYGDRFIPVLTISFVSFCFNLFP